MGGKGGHAAIARMCQQHNMWGSGACIVGQGKQLQNHQASEPGWEKHSMLVT
jgi:hypothetical protein